MFVPLHVLYFGVEPGYLLVLLHQHPVQILFFTVVAFLGLVYGLPQTVQLFLQFCYGYCVISALLLVFFGNAHAKNITHAALITVTVYFLAPWTAILTNFANGPIEHVVHGLDFVNFNLAHLALHSLHPCLQD